MARTGSADRERYWQEAIARQQASGQSIVRFCAKEGLSPASFHAWKQRFRQLQRLTRREPAREPLVPVQIVTEPVEGTGRLEVQWPNGVVLRAQGCDGQTISAAITALSGSLSTRRIRRC
jgi:hypothetical protein